MSDISEVDPQIVFETRRQEALVSYDMERVSHKERFYNLHPDLAKERDMALDDNDDLINYYLEPEDNPYDDLQYRRNTSAISWIEAQERVAFLRSQRQAITDEQQELATTHDLDHLIEEAERDVLLREYLRKYYTTTQDAQAHTKRYDFPVNEGIGHDWLGVGDAVMEARMQETIFALRFEASDYQDFGYAQPKGETISNWMIYHRDARELEVPSGVRNFFYQPFTRNPLEILEELVATKQECTDEELKFINYDYLGLFMNDESTTTVRERFIDEYTELEEWWQGLEQDKQVELYGFQDRLRHLRLPLIRQLVGGFAPVFNLALRHVKSNFPHFNNEEDMQIIKQDMLNSAIVFFDGYKQVLEAKNHSVDNMSEILSYLFTSVLYGLSQITLSQGRQISFKDLKGTYKSPRAFLEDLISTGYSLDDNLPESLVPFSPRTLANKTPVMVKARKNIRVSRGPGITKPFRGADAIIIDTLDLGSVAPVRDRPKLTLPGLEDR